MVGLKDANPGGTETELVLPGTTFFLSFYDREGMKESVQEYTDEATAQEALELFNEPDSRELYSRITLKAFNWNTGSESTLRTLYF